MPNPVPSGLPFAVIGRLGRFAKTRARLYALHFLWSLFIATVVLLAALIEAIEPMPGWRWLPKLVGILFVPGLPEHIVNIIVRFPPLGFVLILVHLILLGVKSRFRSQAWQEYAFQAWQRTPTAIPNMLPSPIPGASGFVKIVERMFPRWMLPLIWLLVAAFVSLVLLDLFYSPVSHAASRLADPTVGCADAYNLCQLRTAEKVRVAIRSNLVRNRTGVWLEKDVPYTARYVESDNWRDHTRPVKPEGFCFEKNPIGLSRFWWMKGMRPYRKGVWFQVIARIEKDRNVFPILDAEHAGKLKVFKPPVSGELVLLVNDVLYRNNHGVMTIEICRCRADEAVDKLELSPPCPKD